MTKDTQATHETTTVTDGNDPVLTATSLKETSMKSKESREKHMKETFDKAYQDAFDTCIDSCTEKMEYASKLGYFRAYLYKWHYVDESVEADKDLFKFNGVRMRDIVTKGDLIKRLQSHFDTLSDETGGFTVGWRSFPRTTPRKYGIYVDWGDHPTSKMNDAAAHNS